MATQEKNKKRNEKINGCILVVLVIAALIIIGVQMIPLIAPFVVAISALVCFIKYMWKDRPHVRANFELSKSELQSFAESKEKCNWALGKINELEKTIANEGLQHNKDGRLSQRSYRGKDVQRALDHANSVYSNERPMCEYYAALPMKRYKEARKHFSRYLGGFLSFVVWGSLVLMAQPDKMLERHLNQTGEAVGHVVDVALDSDKHDRDQYNTQNVTDSVDVVNGTKELQQAEKQASEDSETTVWSAFVTLAFVYLSVFAVTYIFFSVKHKKPKVGSLED